MACHCNRPLSLIHANRCSFSNCSIINCFLITVFDCRLHTQVNTMSEKPMTSVKVVELNVAHESILEVKCIKKIASIVYTPVFNVNMIVCYFVGFHMCIRTNKLLNIRHQYLLGINKSKWLTSICVCYMLLIYPYRFVECPLANNTNLAPLYYLCMFLV